MIVIHGAWVPAQGADPAQFAVWGETAQLERAPGLDSEGIARELTERRGRYH